MGIQVKRQFKQTNYQVDTEGNVYGPWKKLKPQSTSGYHKVTVYEGSKSDSKQLYIHRMVAETFIPNPKEYKEVNHKNGVKTDNRVQNLEWCDRQYNIDHYWENK